MIESSTQLFEDIQSELQQPSSSNLKTKVDEDSLQTKTDYLFHHLCVYSFFIRMSWQNKLNFLTSLIKGIKSVESLSLLLNTLHAASGKMFYYDKALVENFFNFDQILHDHNRMLDDTLLEEIVEADIRWYNELDDPEQVSLLISLLRVSGGSIPKRLYSRISKLYRQRLATIPRLTTDTVVTETDEKVKESPIEPDPLTEEAQEKQADKTYMLREIQHDPNDPLHIECEKLTKKWNEMMAKYSKRVEDTRRELAGEKEKGKQKTKGKTSAKTDKSSSKKDEKGLKKKRKGKTKAGGVSKNEVDWIQLMPVWIVKKILGYVDTKTLKKAVKVNDYWKYIINDLFQDKKVRKQLNQTIAKLRSNFNPNYITELPFPKQVFPKRVSFTEKRIMKCLKRGAVLPKLRETSEPLIQSSLLQSAVIEREPDYIFPTKEAASYPRVIKRFPIYNSPDCIVKDLNLILFEDANLCQTDSVTELTFSASLLSTETTPSLQTK